MIAGASYDDPITDTTVGIKKEAAKSIKGNEVPLGHHFYDPAKPTAQAVAVVGDRILAVGPLEDLKAAAGKQPYRVGTTFTNQVIVPGFIAQYDHPMLAALTMTSEIIAIEDWVLPQGTSKAAKNRREYLARLAAANVALKDPNAVLLTWGYHQYFHGELKKAGLDAVSTTRPILVWHRSAHEFFLNDAALRLTGIDEALIKGFSTSAQEQLSLAKRHFYEQGAMAILGKLAPHRRMGRL